MRHSHDSNATLVWQAIEERVLESLNLDEPGMEWAVSRWREHVANVHKMQDAAEVTCVFTSPEVLVAAVDFLRADIEEYQAMFQANVARMERI